MATAAVGNAPRTAAARSSVWTRGELAWAEASEGGGGGEEDRATWRPAPFEAEVREVGQGWGPG
jgi:hypothetical protein